MVVAPGKAPADVHAYALAKGLSRLDYLNTYLEGREFLVGDSLTGADIQMSFVAEAARDLRAQYPAMDAWIRRLWARPAYQRGLQRGGPYALATP